MSNLLPGAERHVEEAVEASLARVGKRGIPEAEVVAQWEGEWGSEAVTRAIDELRTEGRIAVVDGNLVAVSTLKGVVGTLEALDEGDGMVRPTDRLQQPLFVPKRRLKGAVDGDLVLARRTKQKRKPGGRPPAGTVLHVLTRRHDTVVGFLERDEYGRGWLVPFDPKTSLDVELTQGADDVTEGEWMVARLDPHPTDAGYARGRVVEVLGPTSRPGVDVLVVLRHYRIPEEFPREVLAAAADFPADPRAEDTKDREDLRDEVTVTIDGASARDFDDAITVERLGDGTFRLGVHIADVSHYVTEGGVIDREAYRRGTSVYYPERAVPMLPESLSNGLCSLRPGVPRLTVSAFLDIDLQGEVVRRRFARTVIESDRRMTYEEVRRLLEVPERGDSEEYGEVLEMLLEGRALMEILLRQRAARGSLDFDLPEGDVILDTDGYMVGIKPGERHVAHRMIEEFMIAANQAVSAELRGHDIPALFRVHDVPDRDRLEELRTLLRPLGIGLEGDLDNLHPSALQEVLRRVEGRPEESFVSAVVLRAQQRAVYSDSCDGHYALSTRDYLHFTSPIRRYPDLVVHRQLTRLVAGRAVRDEETERRMPVIADHASETERRAERSERELLQWKKVRFLADRVGDRFPGRITGVVPFGLFVQLEDFFVDGLVPIATMSDDYYRFEPDAHRLIGTRTGRIFRLAQEVEVELVGISERHRGLDLELVLPGAGDSEGVEGGSGGRDGGRHRSGRRRKGRKR